MNYQPAKRIKLDRSVVNDERGSAKPRDTTLRYPYTPHSTPSSRRGEGYGSRKPVVRRDAKRHIVAPDIGLSAAHQARLNQAHARAEAGFASNASAKTQKLPKKLIRWIAKTAMRRNPQQASCRLDRSPLLVEVVSALAVGPSPHVRPDLIGRTIAGGNRVKGATTTADVGLRSGPEGFAPKAHKSIAPPGRYSKRKKRKRRKK